MRGLNRALLVLLGLVMLIVGCLGALVLFGALEAGGINDVIPYQDVWDDWNRIDWQQDGPQWALLGGAIVVALIALVLLLRELSARRGAGDTRVFETTPRGNTTLSTRALRMACARDARTLPGVEAVEVEELHVEGGAGPRARYRVRADETAHLPTLGRQVADRAASSLGQILGRPVADVTVVMEVRHDRRATKHERRVE